MTDDTNAQEPITVFACGQTTCDHAWDGPEAEFESGYGGVICTATCSKCRRTAFDVSMWEGP